ncbi:MAG: hypothetical protein ACLUUE_05105 [Romboutsia timonensis]
MAMKKKFLGLAMAAMVALPAAAYADTAQWNEGETKDVNVTVSGSVKSNTGIAPQGKLEVELPVSMDFSVDQNGTFSGTSYKVTNRSQHDVAVSVADFKETNKQGGITLLGTSAISTLNSTGKRNEVIMALVGDGNEYVDLGAFNKTADSQKKLLVVPKNNGVGTIRLEGIAGTKDMDQVGNVSNDTGVAETFELVFQIKKN